MSVKSCLFAAHERERECACVAWTPTISRASCATPYSSVEVSHISRLHHHVPQHPTPRTGTSTDRAAEGEAESVVADECAHIVCSGYWVVVNNPVKCTVGCGRYAHFLVEHFTPAQSVLRPRTPAVR